MIFLLWKHENNYHPNVVCRNCRHTGSTGVNRLLDGKTPLNITKDSRIWLAAVDTSSAAVGRVYARWTKYQNILKDRIAQTHCLRSVFPAPRRASEKTGHVLRYTRHLVVQCRYTRTPQRTNRNELECFADRTVLRRQRLCSISVNINTVFV